MNEIINIEFCEECKKGCCYVYKDGSKKRVQQILHEDNNLQYNIKPFYNIYKEDKLECEFLGDNGCIIPREERPIVCREFACEKLLKYLENYAIHR